MSKFYNIKPVEEIEKLLNYKFSVCAIKTKAGKLGLTTPQCWTEEEHQKLVENYPYMSPQDVQKMIPNKSLNAIKNRAAYYGIKSGVNKEYTKAEDLFLTENYLSMTDKEIACHLGRTPCSVKQHREFLKLTRPTKALEASISKYLREHNFSWRTESAKLSGNKCVITGRKSKVQIHHKYSMNMIVDAVLSEYPVEKYQSCEEIPLNLLQEIQLKFYEEQQKHGYGVCVCEEYHKKFHMMYGYGYNTPEQWDEFVASLKQ